MVWPGPGLRCRARLSMERVCPAWDQGQCLAEAFVMVPVVQVARCSDGDGGSVALPVSGAGVPQEELARADLVMGDVCSEHPGSPHAPALPGARGSARTLLLSRWRVTTTMSVTPASKKGCGASRQLHQPNLFA